MLDAPCRQSNYAIIGFSMNDRTSFEETERFLRHAHECNLPIVVVGNKIDLIDKREISTEEARQHFESMEPSVPYFETSAKTGEGVNELFEGTLRFWLEKCDYFNRNENDMNEIDEKQQEEKCIIC